MKIFTIVNNSLNNEYELIYVVGEPYKYNEKNSGTGLLSGTVYCGNDVQDSFNLKVHSRFIFIDSLDEFITIFKQCDYFTPQRCSLLNRREITMEECIKLGIYPKGEILSFPGSDKRGSGILTLGPIELQEKNISAE